MATTNNTITLKLLVDKKSNKVLFAEASKEFVDFLFYILSLPVGTVVNLLTKEGMVGSLGNLYASLENLSDNYMQPSFKKDSILNPKVPNTIANVNLLMLSNVDESTATSKNLYRCSYTSSYVECRKYVSYDHTARCPNCQNPMSASTTLVGSTSNTTTTTTTVATSSATEGFVKGVVTYTVMDDLVVKPMSTISSITLLSTFNVKDIGVLEEKEINFGMDEAMKLIKTSMESMTVLTDVFLGKKRSTTWA